jgi:hypothetical protein
MKLGAKLAAEIAQADPRSFPERQRAASDGPEKAAPVEPGHTPPVQARSCEAQSDELFFRGDPVDAPAAANPS